MAIKKEKSKSLCKFTYLVGERKIAHDGIKGLQQATSRFERLESADWCIKNDL